ncbi:MAG: hypothetical protein HC897_01575 [Thermoanaerobaculia bacterium]|nr:hypothetical protein [Thermoanaerobaculia bacterium]
MSARTTHRRSEIVSGIFIVVALVIFGLFAFKVGRFDLMGLFRPQALVCRSDFLDVESLRVGAEVKVGGRTVGQVTALNLVDRLWTDKRSSSEPLHRLVNEVVYELRDPSLRIDPASAEVSIAQDSPLAPHFLALDPGRWTADRVPPPIFSAGLAADLELPAREAIGFDDLLEIAGPALTELLEILQTLNRQVLTPQNMETVSALVDDLGHAAAGGRQVVEKVDRDLLSPEKIAAIDRMVTNLDGALSDGRQVAARLDRLLDPEQDPRLDTTLTQVAELTEKLNRDLEAIQANLTRVLKTTDRTVSSTSAELSEALRRLQRALWQGEMALRKIRANPAVLLFGDNETDLEARDGDLTEIRLEGRAPPYEQRDEKDEKN